MTEAEPAPDFEYDLDEIVTSGEIENASHCS